MVEDLNGTIGSMNNNWLIAFAVLWVGAALILGLSMSRHGHDFVSWVAVGLSMGPFAIILAVDARRRADERKVQADAQLIKQRHSSATITQQSGRAIGAHPRSRHEAHDIAVGVDGSENCLNALNEALELLGDRVKTCMLVAVGDVEAIVEEQFPGAHPIHELLARAHGQACMDHPEVNFSTLTRAGRPAEELCTVAEKGDYQLLVIGASGSGAAHALLGSTATEVIRASHVPVFVGSQRKTTRLHPIRDAIEVGAAPLLNAGWPV